MQVPRDLAWELVVVDNGSVDHTRDVVESFADRLMVRYLREPQRGHAHASNCAVDAARGAYIIWTDDDVVVDPFWLAAYVEAFRQCPEAAVFGGPIIPKYAPPVPAWIVQNEALLGGAFGARDFDELNLSGAANPQELPYGANFAVRSEEQRAFRYNTNLGHRPGQRRLGEETDVMLRILQSGATGRTVPQARVQHCIRPDMQTIAFVAARAASWGESRPVIEGAKHADTRWFGAPRWLWRRLVGEWVRYQIHRWISPAPVWVRHLVKYSEALGAIRYWKSQRI
jgi:glycosyltransferase involved in cell wall biosynthesis